ncbi:unnamed protein product, partial [Brassica rapa]
MSDKEGRANSVPVGTSSPANADAKTVSSSSHPGPETSVDHVFVASKP